MCVGLETVNHLDVFLNFQWLRAVCMHHIYQDTNMTHRLSLVLTYYTSEYLDHTEII